MRVLVTGAKGMIGSRLVEELRRQEFEVIAVDRVTGEGITQVDLVNKERLREVAEKAERFIHLAALAHTAGMKDLSWEAYKRINVDCAKNVFEVAEDRPVLFISTVDVYGFYDGRKPVNGRSAINPVSLYGKSKAKAEEECKKLKRYDIFRFSPVYTDNIKRDIQKRYYLKYPRIAYQIGKGTEFEILNVKKAVQEMADWCKSKTMNEIKIIKDEKNMWTPDYIKAEKEAGRAKVVLKVPRWMASAGYKMLKCTIGNSEKVYLLNKAIYPLRSE